MHAFPFTAPTFCPDGFIGSIHWQYCYKLIVEQVTFTQAKKNCGKLGARLLAMRGDLINSRTAEFDIFNVIREYYDPSGQASQCKYNYHNYIILHHT